MKTLLLFSLSVLALLSSCSTSGGNLSKVSLLQSDIQNRIHLSQVSNLAKQLRLVASCFFDTSTVAVHMVYLNEDTILLEQGSAWITQPSLDSQRLQWNYFEQPLSLQLADQNSNIFYHETFSVPEALEFSLVEGQYPQILPGSTLQWNGPANPDETLYFYLDYDPVANPRHNKKRGLKEKIRWLVKVPDIGHYTFQEKDFPRTFPNEVKLAMSAIRITKQEVPFGESQMNLMLHSEVQGFFVYKQGQNLN